MRAATKLFETDFTLAGRLDRRAAEGLGEGGLAAVDDDQGVQLAEAARGIGRGGPGGGGTRPRLRRGGAGEGEGGGGAEEGAAGDAGAWAAGYSAAARGHDRSA